MSSVVIQVTTTAQKQYNRILQGIRVGENSHSVFIKVSREHLPLKNPVRNLPSYCSEGRLIRVNLIEWSKSIWIDRLLSITHQLYRWGPSIKAWMLMGKWYWLEVDAKRIKPIPFLSKEVVLAVSHRFYSIVPWRSSIHLANSNLK